MQEQGKAELEYDVTIVAMTTKTYRVRGTDKEAAAEAALAAFRVLDDGVPSECDKIVNACDQVQPKRLTPKL